MPIQLPDKPFETSLELLKWLHEVFQKEDYHLRRKYWFPEIEGGIFRKDETCLEYFQKHGVDRFCLIGGLRIGSGNKISSGNYEFSNSPVLRQTYYLLQSISFQDFFMGLAGVNDQLGREAVLSLLEKAISSLERRK